MGVDSSPYPQKSRFYGNLSLTLVSLALAQKKEVKPVTITG